MSKRRERRGIVASEAEGLDFGDPRRDARGLLVAERLAFRPEASLPTAMLGEAELEAVYRHLSSMPVSLEKILRPHVERTIARVREAQLAYVIHDTTSMTFGGEATRTGLGPINGKDQGFLCHLSLAVSAEGERAPLGLMGMGTRVRKRVGKPDGTERHKWALGIAHASHDLPVEQLIHLADREADIYELVSWLASEGRRFIIRAAQNRVTLEELGEEVELLFAAAAEASPLLDVEVKLGGRAHGNRPEAELKRFPPRKERMAHLAFSARRLSLKRPRNGSRTLEPAVALNVVRVWEPEPPKGEDPIEWVLLTTEPIGTTEDVRRVVDGYRTRWFIEEYIKTLKTGCKYEAAQLESAHALFNFLGYCAIVAYAMLLMRALSRTGKSLPASHFFTVEQIACLASFSRRVKLPKSPTLQEALLACAGLGGHLKRNGPPGWRTLSSGYSRLLDYEQGYLDAKAETCDQS